MDTLLHNLYLQKNINNDWRIESKLNTINSEKGASILHMIKTVLGGKEKFQSALQTHWKNRKEVVTDGTDILNDLLLGRDLDGGDSYCKYLENWVFSPGYPLLTARLKEANVTDVTKVTQKRFLYPTSDSLETDSNWYIPLTGASEFNNPSEMPIDSFYEPGDDVMYFFGHDRWLIFNGQGDSFYRVNYEEVLWKRIFNGLSTNRSSFLVLQRAKLLDDIFNVARIGDVSYSMAFEMADSLVNETEYYPWCSAFGVFSYLLGKMEDDEIEWNLKNYILNLMDNIIVIPNASFVDDTDTHIDVLKKVMVLNWACKLGHEECIDYTTGKFKNYKKSQKSLEDYNARRVIFCNGIRHSKHIKGDWNFLWNVYNTSSSVHEQNDILNALGCAENNDLLKSYLLKVITENSGIKRQDALAVFKSVFSSSLGLQIARDFLEDNFSNVQNFYKDIRISSQMIYAVAEKLISDGDINWLKNLLEDKILDDYEDIRLKAKTLAAVNNYWQKKFRSGVTELFPSTSTTTMSTETTKSTATTRSTEPITTAEPSTTTESRASSIYVNEYFAILIIGRVVIFR